MLQRQLPKQQHQPLSKREVDDDDDFEINDEVTFGRNRRSEKFGELVHEKEDELSDYVIVRLALARAKAMQKYREARA